MGRTVKIAAIAGLGGSCFALAVVWLAQGPALTPYVPETAAPVGSDAAAIPERCRVITIPESGCEAAWAAKRRAFFGSEDRAR